MVPPREATLDEEGESRELSEEEMDNVWSFQMARTIDDGLSGENLVEWCADVLEIEPKLNGFGIQTPSGERVAS